MTGLRPLRDDGPVDLYESIRTRYERAATLITSNRSAPDMGALFWRSAARQCRHGPAALRRVRAGSEMAVVDSVRRQRHHDGKRRRR